VREARGQRLDRDVATQAGVAGTVDLTHASGAEEGDDLVGSDAGSGVERHGGG
jgi:hypothetical protein